MQILARICITFALLLSFGQIAKATNCPAYSNTLTNGTTADANAVMGNFNSILNCANNNLAPATGGTLTNTTLSGTTPTQRLQFPDGTTQTSAGGPAVTVRQTVMSGPALSGLPNFLPATSSNLTLGAQNVSSATPLTLTAAQGFGTAGAINLVYQFTSNPSWTATASATNYHYINVQTGATGTTTVQPNYQFGGSIPVTSGQFTFDYQTMIGYLGNGTAAIATPVVFVGESVASASAITSVVAYAYNGYFDSGFTAGLPAASTLTAKASNIGMPGDAQKGEILFQNTTTDLAYVPGDTVFRPTAYQSASSLVTVVTAVLSRNSVSFMSSPNGFVLLNKSTGNVGTMTNASWKYKVVVQRAW